MQTTLKGSESFSTFSHPSLILTFPEESHFIFPMKHPADFFPKIRNLGIDFCRRFEYVVRTDGR